MYLVAEVAEQRGLLEYIVSQHRFFWSIVIVTLGASISGMIMAFDAWEHVELTRVTQAEVGIGQ